MSARLAFVLLIAACRPERYPPTFHDCAVMPEDAEPTPPDLSGYVNTELFDDERLLVGTPHCSAPPAADDDALRATCETTAHGAPNAGACRAACVAAGREQMGALAYKTIVSQLNLLHQRMEERKATTCAKALKTGNTATGDGARGVWRCLGLAELPASASLMLVFHPVTLVDNGTTLSVGQGDLEHVYVGVQLIPQGPQYKFTLSRSGRGCTTSGWHLWARRL